jgi:glucose/arabinose dehydrogenase
MQLSESRNRHWCWLAVFASVLGGCDRRPAPPPTETTRLRCDADNGGLTLPAGFCAIVVADYLANLRGLAISARGDLYATILNRRLNTGGLIAMRDTDSDGRADEFSPFGDVGGVGLQIRGDYLYLGADTVILRYRLGDAARPAGKPEVVVSGLPAGPLHASKTMAFDDQGGLFVSIGAPSNACQQTDRSPGSPGRDPCPELANSAGVWRFDADRPGQRFDDGHHYASGIRHALALDWNPADGAVYVIQHGREALSELWPQWYTTEQDEQLPSEEMLRLSDGASFSWPYCYHDPQQGRRVLAPEYGGDGMRVDRCASYPGPVAVFPAHFGPNDMLFYRGSQFPRRYRGGAFIAFHGSYRGIGGNRTGHQIVFVPTDKGVPGTSWEVFADGFAGSRSSAEAAPQYRPTAIAEGPDGSLYVADSVSGRIWRIVYRATRPPPAAVPPIPGPASGNSAATPQSQGNKAE